MFCPSAHSGLPQVKKEGRNTNKSLILFSWSKLKTLLSTLCHRVGSRPQCFCSDAKMSEEWVGVLERVNHVWATAFTLRGGTQHRPSSHSGEGEQDSKAATLCFIKGWHNGANVKCFWQGGGRVLAGRKTAQRCVVTPWVNDCTCEMCYFFLCLVLVFPITYQPRQSFSIQKKRKLPSPLTFWSSSFVHGPFTSSGFSTFCQRCWHWPSVLPCDGDGNKNTHHAPLWQYLRDICASSPCAFNSQGKKKKE